MSIFYSRGPTSYVVFSPCSSRMVWSETNLLSPVAGAPERIASLRSRFEQLNSSIARYESKVAMQMAQLAKMNKHRDGNEDYDDEEDENRVNDYLDEAQEEIHVTEEDLRKEDEEIRELEKKKQGLEDRVSGMERDLGGLLR